jgi:uncharacterized RDD family membrane protein YckC
MNQEHQTLSNLQSSNFLKNPISLSFDDFEITAESFRPVTKGLGFHQEQQKTNFKQISRTKIEKIRSQAPLGNMLRGNETRIKNLAPMGLEAFYGATAPVPEIMLPELDKDIARPAVVLKNVSPVIQLFAWIIDVAVILSSVVITGVALMLASRINFGLIQKLVSSQDLMLFTSSIFAIYYILYFTILDISSSPGKTIFGIRLVGTDQNTLTMKNTFIRSLVSLFSLLAFCFPLLLDFQGRLSDTRIVK